MKKRRTARRAHGFAPLTSRGLTDEEVDQWYGDHAVDLFQTPGIDVVTDLTSVSWLAPRMSELSGTVTDIVPGGYDAYARILFPVEPDLDPADRIASRSVSDVAPQRLHTRWSTVARNHTKTAHALMQWHAITDGRDDSGTVLDELDSIGLTSLCEILCDHTTTPDIATFLFWDGYGNIHRRTRDGAPTVELPLQRRCFVVRGSVRDAGIMPLKIQVFFPDDRSWCYGSDTDITWAFVGGTSRCVQDLVDSLTLESFAVSTRDTFFSDGDLVNDPDGTTSPWP